MEFLTQVINNGNLAAMSHHLFHTQNYGQHLNNYQASANESVSYVNQFNSFIVSFFVGDRVTYGYLKKTEVYAAGQAVELLTIASCLYR